MWCFRKFPVQGVIAIYDEAEGGGEIDDFDAPRNAPAKSPEQHLDKVYWHSHFDLLEVLVSREVAVNHASIAIGTGVGGTNQTFNWNATAVHNLLIDLTPYGLTREPFALAAIDNNIIWPGMPVQIDLAGSGRGRYGTIYTTTTGVYLYENSSRSGTVMPAATLTYDVIVFKDPRGDENDQLKSFDPDTGEYQMGRGRFSSLRSYLQVAPGGSPLGFSLGRTIDLKNGSPRAVRPDGTVFDPIPSTIRVTVSPGTGAYGPFIAYDGTFTGEGAVQVQTP